jgi:hypothetical protein
MITRIEQASTTSVYNFNFQIKRLKFFSPFNLKKKIQIRCSFQFYSYELIGIILPLEVDEDATTTVGHIFVLLILEDIGLFLFISIYK